ncbi:DTW domain-containing protein YfiP [Cocos nucifera]|uniref:tRNA-uridine aminocarboxypropyltransferase n=1 Tax=Cocos nucifera TaxID=13894 RepID=A0A8K0I3Q0_COCNU|nr:DTW domain-containing protein YfiP [Cocos nucifera]
MPNCQSTPVARPACAVQTTRCFLASSPPNVPTKKTWVALRASTTRESSSMADGAEGLSLEEWQGWAFPAMVAEVIRGLKSLEQETNSRMSFGGLGGKLQGSFKVQEDIKHRALYNSLSDPEKKLQYFAARQVACRLIGSRGYLCQKCWLPMEDCMCSKLVPCPLGCGIKFWIYMHPKDFLRQNNTGKLLWQTFGIQAANLCLFGIHEHEEIMWDTFRHSGKNMVWFLYPNKSLSPKSVEDIFFEGPFTGLKDQKLVLKENPLNFVLIDGTWSNSAAMYRRLKAFDQKLTGGKNRTNKKDRWISLWDDEDLPCISLSTLGASVMHKLRPQPSWDHTCTAAAASGLLSELHQRPELSVCGLDKQAEAVENALDVLIDALTTRRLRMGRNRTHLFGVELLTTVLRVVRRQND